MLMQYMTTGDSSSWNALFSYRAEGGERERKWGRSEWQRQEGGEGTQRDGEEKWEEEGGDKKKLSEDERIERRGDGKPNQFSLVVIPIRRQS